MSRSRKTEVNALHGGDECQGENVEKMVCNEQDCPSEPVFLYLLWDFHKFVSSSNIVFFVLRSMHPRKPML